MSDSTSPGTADFRTWNRHLEFSQTRARRGDLPSPNRIHHIELGRFAAVLQRAGSRENATCFVSSYLLLALAEGPSQGKSIQRTNIYIIRAGTVTCILTVSQIVFLHVIDIITCLYKIGIVTTVGPRSTSGH